MTPSSPNDPRRGLLSTGPDHTHHRLGNGFVALAGMLGMQTFIGYEWLMSGLTKVVRGGFVSGLAGELTDKVKNAPHWYAKFVHSTVIPNSRAFAVAIEVGELLVGVTLITTALLWLLAWPRLGHVARMAVLVSIALASVSATFMAINFHLASGAPNAWIIPKRGFDEGIDLDSLLPLLQLVLLGVAVDMLVRVRHHHRGATPESSGAQPPPEQAIVP